MDIEAALTELAGEVKHMGGVPDRISFPNRKVALAYFKAVFPERDPEETYALLVESGRLWEEPDG